MSLRDWVVVNYRWLLFCLLLAIVFFAFGMVFQYLVGDSTFIQDAYTPKYLGGLGLYD